MSVAMVPNWSDIRGVVRSRQPATDMQGFVPVTIAVGRVDAVDSFANLLSDTVGKELVVLVPEGLANTLDITAGDMIVCRVRRAGLERIFVHQQHISVHHP